jgi:fatty acid desaturase
VEAAIDETNQHGLCGAAYDDKRPTGRTDTLRRPVLDGTELQRISQRSDLRGAMQLGAHTACIAATTLLVWVALPFWYLLVPAMVVHGVTIVTLFAPMHECVHRTAFASRTANVIIGWIAGVLSFYNSTYYRHYHSWHHRYTQDPTRDPELMFPKARNYVEYITSRPPGSAAASASSRRARRCRMCGIGRICGRRRCGRPSWSAPRRPNAGSCA